MTQVRDGLALAPGGARRLRVARRLSVVAAMFVIPALVAGTAGTSYAKHHHKGAVLLDNVTVSNYGAAFGGSVATFAAGRGPGDAPFLLVKGTNTLLGSGTGPAGVSVSSLDDHVAVTIPIDLLDLTGFGAAAGLSNGPGTGFVEIFSPGANGNSAPETLIGTRNVSFDNTGCLAPGSPLVCCTGVNTGTCQFNFSGVNTPQGLAFEDPYDGVNPGKDIVAIANTLPASFFSTMDFLDASNGGAACAAFGGFTVGTITEFDRATLTSLHNDNVTPINDNPVCTLPAAAIPPGTEPPTFCPTGSANSATIGGCLTFLLGPVGLAFDQSGILFAVNEAGVASGGPGFVTAYAPGAHGDAYPIAVVGLVAPGPTAGAFVDPVKIAVLSGPVPVDCIIGLTCFPDDIIAVTDVGDNSVKIFSPFTNFSGTTFFFEGTELGTIHGGNTKFKRPEGIALGVISDALYVVNNSANTLEMFTDFSGDTSGGDIPPTLIVSGRNTKLNFPVDVALQAFTPSPTPSSTVSAGAP
jgi:hypothetical protein